MLGLWASVLSLKAALPLMRPYVIELPHHVLLFSLPEEIARGMTSMEVERRFDPQDESFLKDGFREIAGTLYDFKGPFWVGALGSLKFGFTVQKRNDEHGGDIATISGLDRHIRSWIGKGKHAGDFLIGRAVLNGIPAVRRSWDQFGDPTKLEPHELEIFSLPLDEKNFLEVDFNVIQWKGGRGKERLWKGKAEELREAIKATVVLKRKPTIAPEGQNGSGDRKRGRALGFGVGRDSR